MGKKVLTVAIYALAIYGVYNGFKDFQAWRASKKVATPPTPVK